MNRHEFLQQTEKALCALPEEERANATAYLNEYFEDAGVEKEQDVIIELKSPQDVAAGIIDDYYQNNPSARPRSAPQNNTQTQPDTPTQSREPQSSGSKTTIPVWAVILLLICLSPFILSVFGVVFGVFVSAVSIVFSLSVVAFVIAVVGIVVIVSGIVAMFSSLLAGMLVVGVGFTLTGIGIIFIMLTIKLYKWLIPNTIKGIVYLCKLPFKNRININNGGVTVESI